ncbi:MAG: UDP-N-acetylglucosamine 4,6-dehydratase (inverting) [Fibrobacterota bacterium]
MFNKATVLITGGTGSFGKKFIRMTLKKFPKVKKIIIYSRDEMKQWEMASEFKDDRRLRYFIGDVRDANRLHRACQGIDFIIHAAALKIVPTAEYNPFEYIKTNIHGAMNVIDCALDQKVKRVIALSTDKACNPINLYGATKLCSDKLFVAGNSYSGTQDTRFAVVRYGNVMGSRGSIIPFFIQQAKTGVLTVTDPRMTRFMISLEQGVELVWHALKDCVGGEIYVKKIPSMKITDVAKAIAPKAKIKIIGIRPGEKIHEEMISVEDAKYTYEYPGYFKILPQIHGWSEDTGRIAKGKRCKEAFSYNSGTNTEWMSVPVLQRFLQDEFNWKGK